MSLLSYWDEHPPLHILVQGIASGLAGRPVGGKRDAPTGSNGSATTGAQHSTHHVQSAEELATLLGGTGIGWGALQMPKSAKPPEIK